MDSLASGSAAAKGTLAQRIADTLRHSILKGVFTCGERLVELSISQDLNVSQNTVRDALRLLMNEGWLVYRPRYGVSVRSFTVEEAEELYALWGALERLAFDWALETNSRVDLLTELRVPMEAARTYHEGEQWSSARQALYAFHHIIARLSRRSQTIAMLEQVHNQAQLLEIDYEHHRIPPLDEQIQRIEAYEHLLGVIKFGNMRTVRQALQDRVTENGKPIIRWLAMHS